MQQENPEILIRPACIDDLSIIFHLGERVFTRKELSNLYRTWDEFEVTSLFNLQPDNMLVAESGARVVGFAIGSVIRKVRAGRVFGHLAWLGVEPEFARCGVGSLLFDHFRELMAEAGVQTLVVDTQADNRPAIEFFCDKGFGSPVEHVYMTLPLA